MEAIIPIIVQKARRPMKPKFFGRQSVSVRPCCRLQGPNGRIRCKMFIRDNDGNGQRDARNALKGPTSKHFGGADRRRSGIYVECSAGSSRRRLAAQLELSRPVRQIAM